MNSSQLRFEADRNSGKASKSDREAMTMKSQGPVSKMQSNMRALGSEQTKGDRVVNPSKRAGGGFHPLAVQLASKGNQKKDTLYTTKNAQSS